jgi:ADP-ribosylglycohydrolase
VTAEKIDKIAGCLVGGALGDAMGLPYEGKAAVDHVGFQSGKVSDDTQLTLATCEGIIEGRGVVRPELIAERFAVWFAERTAGTHRRTLRRMVRGGAGHRSRCDDLAIAACSQRGGTLGDRRSLW